MRVRSAVRRESNFPHSIGVEYEDHRWLPKGSGVREIHMKPPVTRFLSELFLLLPAVLLSNILCGDSYAQKAGQAAARPEAAKRVVNDRVRGDRQLHHMDVP